MGILGKFLRSLSPERAPAATPDAKQMPDPLRAARILGASLAMQQNYAEAIEALRAARDPSRPDAGTANLVGVCHSLLGQYGEAMRCYDEANSADPRLADAWLNGGVTAFLLGRPDEKQRFHRWLALRGNSQPAGQAARSGARLTLPNVTLCCVDCAYHDLAARALKASLTACAFGDALFLSDRDCHVPGVRFGKIAPIASSAAYSNFMIHQLHEHIRTDFVLVIQYDGFALHPDAWDPAFLAYDYAGAPMRVGDGLVVGNGGFSLRSRKLLHALRDDAQCRNYDAARGDPVEDAAICGSFRRRLESVHGIRFAPPDLADRFAAGRALPTRRSFGFHGLVHLVRLHEENFETPDSAEDGISVEFRAETELGRLAVQRQLEVSGPAGVWGSRSLPQE
jgi:tetratricopeptide (TPR) repeat protein